jgi:hypothetical protein
MTIPSRRSISVAEMQNLTDANAWIRSYAAEQGYPLYDVFYTLDNPAWYNHLLSWYQGPLDGVHINKLGNEIWGRSIDTNMVQTHTVEFAPGETSKTITLHTTDDYRNTSDKEMYVRMSNPHNATYGTNTLSTVTIQESGNEFAIGFDYASYTVPENAGNCVLTVFLSKLSSSTVTVDYNTVDGSALSGVNYEAISGRVVFDPGETSKTLTIPIKNDFADTGNIDFTISLSNENGVTIGDNGTATITIVDTGVLRKTMNMAHSWNFVSFPLVNNSLYATDLGGFGVSRIAIYNNTTNAYNTYVLGFSAGDMPILPQKAYFVYSNGSQIIDYGTSPSAYNVTLYSGWNAIGWQSSTNSTASTVSASIPNIQRICRYNTSTGAYNTYVPVYSSADKDFTMSEGNGYFVYKNSPTPEELTIS